MPCHPPHQSPAKKAEQLLDAPRATGRQSALSECCEFVVLFVAQILRIEQQRLSHAFEAVVTRLLQFAVLRASNLVDRFIQILRNVKTVVDN